MRIGVMASRERGHTAHKVARTLGGIALAGTAGLAADFA
jgi:hypothetical protein